MAQLHEAELDYLTSHRLLEPLTQADMAKRIAFEKEKLEYMVNYLTETKQPLACLGLAHPFIDNPKLNSPKRNPPTLGTTYRSHKPPKPRPQKIKMSAKAVLQEYCENGMDGLQSLFKMPPRDEKKIKELLRTARSAWARHVKRKTIKQLPIDVPIKLWTQIDELYDANKINIDGSITTKNEWLVQQLRILFDQPI